MGNKILVAIVVLVVAFFAMVYFVGGHEIKERDAEFAKKSKQSVESFKDRWNPRPNK